MEEYFIQVVPLGLEFDGHKGKKLSTVALIDAAELRALHCIEPDAGMHTLTRIAAFPTIPAHRHDETCFVW
jgi:hypothetical protein